MSKIAMERENRIRELEGNIQRFETYIESREKLIETLQDDLARMTRLKAHWQKRAMQLRRERDAARKEGE